MKESELKGPAPVGSTESSRPASPRPPRRLSFDVRFGIIESEKDKEKRRFYQFKNRTLDTIDRVLGSKILDDQQLERDYLHFLGRRCPTTMRLGYKNLAALIDSVNRPDRSFDQTWIYQSLNDENSLVEYCRCLDGFFSLPLSEAELRGLYGGFTQDLAASSIPVRIAHRGDYYAFYPRGPRVLDENVIDDDLEWLSDYKTAIGPFRKALTQYSDPTRQHDALDSLRRSMENFLRQLLGNGNALEDNKTVLIQWMKNHGTNAETQRMMKSLFQGYYDYQNSHVKHGDEGWKPVEVDFILYLTATFIHLLIELSRAPSSAIEGSQLVSPSPIQ